MEIIVSHVDVIQMRILAPIDIATISLDNAWHALETRGAGTVTHVFLAIMGTLGMDFVSHVNATCMDQETLSVTQEQASACAKKSTLVEHVGSVRMDLVQSGLVVDSVAAIKLDQTEIFVMRILDNVSADPGLQD